MTKRRTEDEISRIVSGIRDLLYKKWSDVRIRSEYGEDGQPMPQSTYYWYLKKIKEEDMKILKNHVAEQVPTEVLNMLKMIDDTIAWCEEHKDDDAEPLKDRMAVQTLKIQLQAGKIQLLLQGPSVADKVFKTIPSEVDHPELSIEVP